MNRSRAVLLVLVGAMAVWGCSVKERIHLFNNSRDTVVIRVKGKEYVAQPSEEVSFVYEHGELAVQVGGCPVLYRTSFRLPPGYKRTGWFRSHITFQIEPDRKAFVLRADDRPPISVASYAQPEGYPLIPALTDGCDG